jgi:hypothetical protein
VDRRPTRRATLGLLALGASGPAIQTKKTQPQSLPQAGEFTRFSDPETETVVVRLTNPAYTHILPTAGNRFILLKPRLLFCSSDRLGGKMMPFEIDLRTGAIRHIAYTSDLDPSSLTLDRSKRSLYFLDGGKLSEVSVGKIDAKKSNVLADEVSAFALGTERAELFLIRKGKLQQQGGETAVSLAEDVVGPCLPRPSFGGCLFGRRPSPESTEFWYARGDRTSKPALLARGDISNAHWSTDGESLLYLKHLLKNDVAVSNIYEVSPENPVERCVCKTSQFASFSTN